ncbi:uncharacterized protein LOC121053469 [Oryza brachyantha]|uniref:uncharacterized protein LOC121053469 n=1 Tax=Oryza brachyantha TaxID=4533 RepID=UPI001ADA4487|nr:uncharacterized protein LOC121053469 [Oryza brachyantha]
MEEESQEQPTETRGRRRRSEYSDHFEQKAQCKYCKALMCTDPAWDGTSRLKKHYEETCLARHPRRSTRARHHHSPAASKQQADHGLQNASTISKPSSNDSGQQSAEDQLVRMIALHGFPPSVMEDVRLTVRPRKEQPQGRARAYAWAGDDEPPYDHIVDVKDYSNVFRGRDEVLGTISSWGLSSKVSTATLTGDFTNSHDRNPYGEHCLLAFVKLCLTRKKRKDISSRLRLNHSWTYNSWWYAFYYALQILHEECSSGAAEIAGLVGEDTFDETDTTELFRTTLGVVYNAIETVSASTCPTSNLSLIETVKLKRKIDSGYNIASRKKDDKDTDDERIDDTDSDEDLTHESDGEDIDDHEEYDAQPAFQRTKKHLDLYFQMRYLSHSIPLILDPRFKLVKVKRLLKKASLPPDCISEVQSTVRQLFLDYSNQSDAREHTNHGNENEMVIIPSQQRPESTLQTVDQSTIEEDHGSSQESGTELDAYLQEKTVPFEEENFDILKWWKENCHRYPTVARMARDFLAMPASARTTPQMMTEITNHLGRYA